MSEYTPNSSEIMDQEPSQAEKQAVEALGSRFHEEWRKNRLNDDGSFEPRMKATKDEAWIEAHGTDQVDIANTDYEALPADWQADNKAAAEAVVGIIAELDGAVDLEDPAIVSKVGNAIHDEWLSRNGEWAPEEQKLPFDDLSAEEQQKDIDQMLIAKEVFNL